MTSLPGGGEPGKRERRLWVQRVGSGGSEAFKWIIPSPDKSDYIRDPEKMRS